MSFYHITPICLILWSVWPFPLVKQDFFVRGIYSVPCLPGQVSLIRLFPCKYSSVLKLGIVASIYQQLSIAEVEVSWVGRVQEWLGHRFNIFRYMTCHAGGLTVLSYFPNRHCVDLENIISFTVAILEVCLTVGRCVSWKQWILTCIAVVEHLNTLGIPVFHESVMTIELHLISLTVIVSLIHNSSVVNFSGLPMPSILNQDRRSVRSFFQFLNVIFEFFK